MYATMEYITAGIIIMLILGATSQYATNMVYDRISLIEKNSVMKKADKIIDIILLSPGKPVDWGRSHEEPEMMGLASENAINLYKLDADKVRCLSIDSTDYIPPGRFRDLLGLSPYYYTAIKVHPIFNITVTQLSAEKFDIKVVNQWKLPVSDVNITAAYLNASIEEVNIANITSFIDLSLDDAVYLFNMTNALGTCKLNFSGAGTRESLLVMASQLSVKCLTTWPILSENIIGHIELSMGSVSRFDTETVYRNVEIDGLNYVVRLTLWS